MKKILSIVLVLFVTMAFAQKKRKLTVNKDTNLIDVVYYHDNGAVSETGNYTIEGKLQGEWISYNEEGKKTVLANYENGKKVGKWIYWIGDTVKEIDYSSNVISSLKESKVEEDL